jgi:hypothetical protein
MGYTPLFETMLTGSLYGRWPHTGVWACLLSRASHAGVIDESPQSLAASIGLPVAELMRCIDDFMKPDPDSRTADHEGRRLELIDPHRSWGWKVINLSLYRAKASGANQVADGRNALKVKRYRERHRATPDETGNTHSDSYPDTNTNTNTDKNEERASAPDVPAKRSDRGTRIPEPFVVTEVMRQWAASKGLTVDLAEATEEFVRYWRATPGQRGRKCDWVGTWQNRMIEVQGRTKRSAQPFKTAEQAAAEKFLRGEL